MSFRGSKIFTSNSLYGLKKKNKSNSPEKKENITSQKETELFRNPEKLKKKKEEILLRKMKRESSETEREIYTNEKDNNIKEQKININIITNNIKPNINKIRIIPINKEINNNNRRNNKNRSNDNEQKKNKFNINIISRNNNEFNNSLTYNNIRKIYKFNNNTINSNDISYIKKQSQDSNSLNYNNNIILYPRKDKFKTNNIFLSKYTGKTPPKNNNIKINNKNKENLDFLSISKNSKISGETNEQTLKNKTNKKYTPRTIIKKKFIEDITYEDPTIYSKDKKLSIKLNILQSINDNFLGIKHTYQKLKMQKVVIICVINDNNKNHLTFPKNYKNINRKNEFRYLASIKEEDEKSKMETSSFLKTEPEKKPVVEKNIRANILMRFNNKK